jgi:hypothetical protein
MKWLVPMVLLTSCQTRRVLTLPNGTHYEDWGHLAGNTTVAIKPDGTAVMHNKMNQPWQDTMQLAGAAITAREAAELGTVVSVNRRITRLGSQRQATAQAQLANELQRLKLAAELEKFRLTHPIPATLPVLP